MHFTFKLSSTTSAQLSIRCCASRDPTMEISADISEPQVIHLDYKYFSPFFQKSEAKAIHFPLK